MASSVEEVAYEFGGLFAVAVLGSLSAALYSLSLPADLAIPEAARQGLVQALDVARAAGDPSWIDAAKGAYDTSYRWGVWLIVGVLAVGAAATARLLRGAAGHPVAGTNPVH